MTISAFARRGLFLVSIAAPALLAGCVSDGPSTPSNAQPRLATYACGEGNSLRIESSGSMVRVTHLVPTDPEAEERAVPEPVDLPAAPPGQNTRFGAEGYALVVEGREALYMKAGRVPLTCRR